MKKIMTLLLLAVLITGCAKEETKTAATRELMGTAVTITVYSDNKTAALDAIDLAFREIERIDNLLSNYKNDSEVSLLNKNGFIENASDDLVYNIKKSLYYSDLTNGAFDITVQPILDLYKGSFENKKRAPTGVEINNTLKLVGYENIYIKHRNISFLKPGMKITLGGIAKGYAVDKAIDILKQNNITNALVNAGGDIMAIGKKANDGEWSIALENPRNKKEYVALIKTSNKAVATSGDYERYFDEDKKFHHIINPRTGYSATELISVTIIADKAIDADALATSVFVLGKGEGYNLIERLKDVDGLIITKDKEIIRSKWFSLWEG